MHHEDAAEKTVVAVDVDRPHHDFLVFRDDVGDVAHYPDVVIAHDAERDGVLAAAFSTPFGSHHAVTETTAKFGGVGTVGTVDLDAAVDGHKTENLVAVNGVAAAGQLIVDAFQLLVDDQHVVTMASERFLGGGITELLGTADRHLGGVAVLMVAQFDVFLDDFVGVEFLVGQLLVEIACLLEAKFVDDVRKQGFFHLHLPVLETAFQHLLGEKAVFHLRLLEGKADF